jgi:hypothetical protein
MTAGVTIRSTQGDAVRVAGAGAAGICLVFAGMQVALAAGAPLGEHVWGGSQERVLPTNMRIVSAGAAIVLTGMATTVARRGGLLGRPAHWQGPATWAIAGYLAFNTVGNLASTDDVERYVFGTATAVASAVAAFVAHRSRSGEVPA